MGDSKCSARRRLSVHVADWQQEGGMTEPDRVVFVVDDDASHRESLRTHSVRSAERRGLRLDAGTRAERGESEYVRCGAEMNLMDRNLGPPERRP